MITLDRLKTGQRLELSGAPPGLDARALATLASAGRDVLHVAREASRTAQLVESLAFFAPEIQALEFPAWDCLPYDRVSPVAEIVSRRIDTLTNLAAGPAPRGGRIVVTTINAILQRVPPRGMFATAGFAAEVGRELKLDQLTAFLAHNGYVRADTVREAGEYALRGGIVDLFPPGTEQPLRLDLFGDTLEAIRSFDPNSQLSGARLKRVILRPVSEVLLDAGAIEPAIVFLYLRQSQTPSWCNCHHCDRYRVQTTYRLF